MTHQEEIKEVAMISAIISDHINKQLYEAKEIGYIAVVDLIADWSIEFLEKHKDTDWVNIFENGIELKPLSKSISSIICWDDCIVDFAYFKLENYN